MNDLIKIIECPAGKYIFDGRDNTINEYSDQAYETLHNKYVNYTEEINNVSTHYDIENIKFLALNRLNHIILSFTNNCNLRCIYCSYHDNKFKAVTDSEMNKSDVKKILDFIIAHSKESYNTTISFYGGEPLLRFDLIKYAVEYIHRQNYTGHKYAFRITTNGTLLSFDIVQFLVKHNIMCSVSLDGPVFIQDRYRVFKEGTPTYDEVIRNLKMIAKKYPQYYNNNVSFQAVVAPPYEPALPKEYFEKAEVRFLDVSIGDHFSQLLRSDYGLSLFGQDFERSADFKPLLLGKMNKKELSDKMQYITSLRKYTSLGVKSLQTSIIPGGFCVPMITRLFIGQDGVIRLCERVDKDNPLFQFGDVGTGYDFNKIDDLYENTRELLKGNCDRCWAIRYCAACFANMDKVNYDGEYCKMFRKEIENGLIDFIDFKYNNKRYKEMVNSISVN